MSHDRPFAVINEDADFENHIPQAEEEYPFEFSKTNLWNQNFFSPENQSDSAMELLHRDLENIKLLIGDIKDILAAAFEINTKTED